MAQKSEPDISTPAMVEIRKLFEAENFKECEELVMKEFKSEAISMDLLIWKIKVELRLGKFKKALRSCKLGLFLQPENLELHKRKLQVLKDLRMFNELSDTLVLSLRLFPNESFT